jgi:hypothetical protein
MSDEHGWPDFADPDGHPDPGGPHDFVEPHEPVDGDDGLFHDDLFGPDDDAGPHDTGWDQVDEGPDAGLAAEESPAWDDRHEAGTGHDDEPGAVELTAEHGPGPVGADPDATADAEQVSVFPPVIDVGPLPEPVDGMPWIDTGSLGLYHAGPVEQQDPVPAAELAEYAAQDLPPGVDPWAALADSDDPATSALARWWSPDA